MSINHDLDWLAGGGEMGKLIRSMDWSKSPLGPISEWPQSLKTAVSLCLSSTFPINIAWGPEFVQIYNDAYRPICGGLHPASMGSKFKECWASALPVVGAHFDRAHNGEGVYIPNQRMFLERHGYLEEAFMTFSFSPIRDESGNVGGIFHPISESTEKMLSSRRTQAIRDLALQVNKAQSMGEMYELATDIQSQLELDLPFMMFCEVRKEGIRMIKDSGLNSNCSLHQIDQWNLNQYKTITQVKDLQTKLGEYKCGPYDHAPKNAMILPITPAGHDTPVAYVIAGVSVAREMDSDYESFYEQIKNTVTTAVTNISAYEEEQKRAQALAEIDKAKTAFFSNVSHEFRTPLTLMLGPLEDSLIDEKNPLNAIQRQRQEVIQRNSMRLLKLVNSLLDFSRIEAGRIQASFEPVNLSKATTDLASLFRSTIEKEGLQLKVEAAPLPEEIYVDKEMWEKIILNLLSNAFKFTFEGTIEVKARWTGLGAEIKVSDTGIGVNAEELPRLFERFHRVQGAKSRTYEGTGIGLALVQELVTMHGGTISVESEIGKGTTFTIFLPKGKAHLPEEKIAVTKTLTSTSLSADAYLKESQMWVKDENNKYLNDNSVDKEVVVLLADDNADMRDYVASILNQNWTVMTAKDGEEAYQLTLREKPDLILSDVMMPVLDGFGLLKKIRQNENLKDTPLILLSARAGEEAKVEGLAAGADDYLVKPFSARELMSRVGAMVKLTRARNETLKNLEKAVSGLEIEKDLREKFVATLTHDLRSPITAAKISAQLIQRRPDHMENSQNHAARIVNNVNRADQMIQDLLDASRIRAGEKLFMEVEDCEMNSLMQEITDNLRTIHGDRIILKTHDTDIQGRWASAKITRMVENLINNAFKYGDPHAPVVVDTKDHGEEISFSVHNVGRPLSAIEQKEIFDPYKRIADTSDGIKGWGLGLTLVKGMAEAHGGNVKVFSGPSIGTTFVVTLPR